MTTGKRASVSQIMKRPTIQEMLDKQQSMLGEALPLHYGSIDTTQEALAAATPPPRPITLRIHIIWDNDVTNLDLERALEGMRETGAAMVVKVEEVS